MPIQIYESSEDYLESILILQKENGIVHSIDVANHLHFSKASVSVAMKKLRENGYINMEKDGRLSLLPPGMAIAERIYERHRVLTDFFVSIGIDQEIAVKDACKIEHDLSDITFQKLKEAIAKMQETFSDPASPQ